MSLDKVKDTYERLGREDPMYAVLSDKRYRHGRWDPAEFFRTGEVEIKETLDYVRGLGLEPGRARALDFGCGVGRLSLALADHFEEVLGVDISSTMLEEAARHNKKGERVRFILNQTDDLSVVESDSVDFVYSNITLQHIPPPHSHNYVLEFFRILRPGGVAVFKIPQGRGDSGSLQERLRKMRVPLRRAWNYLRGRAPVEYHKIPRAEVEALVHRAGGKVLNVFDLDESRRGRRLGYCATK